MGYAGKLLRVNLSTGEIKTEQLDFALSRMFLGGRGLASKILYDEIDPKVNPLSPENKIILLQVHSLGQMLPQVDVIWLLLRDRLLVP